MSSPSRTVSNLSGAVSNLSGSARRRLRAGLRAVRSQRQISRLLLNAGPVRRYRRRPALLGEESARVWGELRARGIARSSVIELLGNERPYRRLQDQAAELRSRDDLVRDPAKPFLTELFGSSPEISPTDPLLELALHPQVRGVAEAYAAMELRVTDVNVWVNTPVDGAPTQSQRWHRDLPEDDDIVKCFVYLSDVPEGAGPLHYVAGTNTRQGRKAKLPAEFDGIGYRLSDDDVARHFGAEQVVSGQGRAGTLVFADTRGIHRGGFARDQERVVGQITYASRACSRPANLRAAAGADRRALRDVRLAGCAK